MSTAPAPPVAAVPVPAPLPAPVGPTPLPVDQFTLPTINKSGSDYLQTWDMIHFWLRSPGFSTSRLDSALIITDTTNSLASQSWEGQLWMALSPFLRYLTRLRQNLGCSKYVLRSKAGTFAKPACNSLGLGDRVILTKT